MDGFTSLSQVDLTAYIEFIKTLRFTNGSPGHFTAMTYNTLADCTIRENMNLYEGIDQQHLSFSTRLQKNLALIQLLNPDLLALQEVDAHTEVFSQHLPEYHAHFKKKTGSKQEGLMLMWKDAVFERIEVLEGEFKARDEDPSNLFHKDEVFILSVLRHRLTQRFVLFCTTHLYFTKTRGDIQIAQLMVLLESISRVCTRYPGISIVLAGEFNLCPNGGAYSYLSHKQFDLKYCPPNLLVGFFLQAGTPIAKMFSSTMREFQADPSKDYLHMYPDLVYLQQTGLRIDRGVIFPKFYPDPDYQPSSVLRHQLDLHSTYKVVAGREAFPTSLIGGEKATVDYLWFSNLKPKRILMQPRFDKFGKLWGCPADLFPSDHLPLMAEYDLN